MERRMLQRFQFSEITVRKKRSLKYDMIKNHPLIWSCPDSDFIA